MRRRLCLGAGALIVGASVVLASASHADDSSSPEALLQQGAKLGRSCLEPKPEWPAAKLSRNLDSCNDAVQAFVKAMEASNDAKVGKAATSSITVLNVNMGMTALDIGRHDVEQGDPTPALVFLRLACTSFDAVSAFDALTPDQTAQTKSGADEADKLLRGYHTDCKTIAAPDK